MVDDESPSGHYRDRAAEARGGFFHSLKDSPHDGRLSRGRTFGWMAGDGAARDGRPYKGSSGLWGDESGVTVAGGSRWAGHYFVGLGS